MADPATTSIKPQPSPEEKHSAHNRAFEAVINPPPESSLSSRTVTLLTSNNRQLTCTYSLKTQELEQIGVIDHDTTTSSTFTFIKSRRITYTQLCTTSPNGDHCLLLAKVFSKTHGHLPKYCPNICLHAIDLKQGLYRIDLTPNLNAAFLLEHNIETLYLSGQPHTWARPHSHTSTQPNTDTPPPQGLILKINDTGCISYYICNRLSTPDTSVHLTIDPAANSHNTTLTYHTLMTWSEGLRSYISLACHTSPIKGIVKANEKKYISWTDSSIALWHLEPSELNAQNQGRFKPSPNQRICSITLKEGTFLVTTKTDDQKATKALTSFFEPQVIKNWENLSPPINM